MQRKLVRIFLSLFLSGACFLPAFADKWVTYVVTMPHYYQDGQQMVGTPNFVVNGKSDWAKFTSGTYEAFEAAQYPANDYFKCKGLAEGYYASKWEVLTSGGKSLFSSTDEMANVQFPYSWYKQHGDSQLRLIMAEAFRNSGAESACISLLTTLTK